MKGKKKRKSNRRRREREIRRRRSKQRIPNTKAGKGIERGKEEK